MPIEAIRNALIRTIIGGFNDTSTIPVYLANIGIVDVDARIVGDSMIQVRVYRQNNPMARTYHIRVVETGLSAESADNE